MKKDLPMKAGLFVCVRLTSNHDRATGADKDVVTDATEQNLLSTRQSATAHDDKVDAFFFGNREDAAGRVTNL